MSGDDTEYHDAVMNVIVRSVAGDEPPRDVISEKQAALDDRSHEECVIRWTDAAGRPRRLRFCERSLGGHDRIEEEWAGDRWRTVGREVVTEVRVRAVGVER